MVKTFTSIVNNIFFFNFLWSEIMFKKICSLIIIALMLLSVIGVCSAGTVTMQYPTLDDISSNTDFYRYSGDKVYTSLFVSNNTNGKKNSNYGWKFPINTQGTLFDGRYLYYPNYNPPTYDIHNYYEIKRLPGYSAVYTIPDSYIGGTIYGQIWDGSYISGESTWLKISNYKDSNIIIHFWDRGCVNDPHIDVRVNGVITGAQNGGNGDDVEFSM
jgi:hypothetical protein